MQNRSGRCFSFCAFLFVYTCRIFAQNGQIRISGEMYVDYGSDKTGLSKHASSGALCVVHAPNCGGVGHNGKDHYFSKKHPLPPGVTLERVDYLPFWPTGLNKTDRGGIGSAGSYGMDLRQPGQNGALVDVQWQNACRDQWNDLPSAYQISFILSGPQPALDAVTKVNASVPATVDPGFACARKEVAGPRPGELSINSFTATWNGQTRHANQTLVIPVGAKAILNWDVEHCGAGCRFNFGIYNGTLNNYQGSMSIQNPKAPMTVSPSSTLTTYALGAYDDASQKNGVIESAHLAVQLTTQGQSCAGCSWFYYKLTSPPDFSTQECIRVAVFAASEALARTQAQSRATNYSLLLISEQDYLNATGCSSS